MIAADLAARLLELLLPSACAGCGGVVAQGDAEPHRICVQCRARLKAPPHPRCSRCDAPRGTGLPADRDCPECHEWPAVLKTARAAVVLAAPADRLVYALKYGGWPELGDAMGSRMIAVTRTDPVFSDLRGSEAAPPVVPVPTTPGRLRRRGYNQARVLASVVSRATGAPLVDALERREGDGSQIGLLPGERRANVEDAFSTIGRATERVDDRDVILVDDVLTTGATATAAAGALERGGARSVRLLTFARSLPELA